MNEIATLELEWRCVKAMKPLCSAVLCLLLTFALIAQQQQPPNADIASVLQKVAGSYTAISDYVITVTQESYFGPSPIRDDGVIAQTTGGADAMALPPHGGDHFNYQDTTDPAQSAPFFYDWPAPASMMLARSGRSFHFEGVVPNNKNKILWITNGQTTWHYGPRLQKYTELPARPWPERAGPGLGLPGLEWQYFTKFRALAGMANRARLVSTHVKSDEACPGPTTEIELQVGTVDQKKTERLRILNSNNLVCESKVEYQTSKNHGQLVTVTTTWRYDQVSGLINPELFTFNPPKGAKRVASFQ